MSTTAAYGRSKSGDRFYNPPGRRQQQQQLLLQQQQQKQKQEVREKEEIRREKVHNHQNQQQIQHQQSINHHVNSNNNNNNNNNNSNHSSNSNQYQQRRQKAATATAVVVGRGKSLTELEECASTTATANATPVASISSSSASSVATSSTNLDRFLEYTTPSVPAQYFSKTSVKAWKTRDEFRPYFVLGDLWESFKEWSAYGAGVPLLLNGSDSVVQYYVPYLSGIQLYIDPSKPSPVTRRRVGESDESSRETSSDGSSDCETDRRTTNFAPWGQPENVESTLPRIKGLSIQSKPFNGSSSDEGESSNTPGMLVFEYFEHDPPYSREPLADKISLLSSRFPELKTYRSCDLSPSSWISVAWYPIYRIPTGPTLQNLDSCFLTFHCLSTPVNVGQNEWQFHYGSCSREAPNGFDIAVKLPLPIFGMASYKFKISMWDQNGVDESPKANSLLQSADEWLRQLNVHHPDYRFFVSHNFWR